MEIVKPEQVGMNGERLARITKHLNNNYIKPSKIAGCITLVARQGKVCYLDALGHADRERNALMKEDTIVRMYSMTKPITSVAIMMLYEQGILALKDPVHRFLPEFKKLRVYETGAYPAFMSSPLNRPMTIKDLLTHTSGLTYDFVRASNVDYAYRKMRIGTWAEGDTTETLIEKLVQVPLEFNPGERWNYSLSVDVLGRIVEVISGMSLRGYFKEFILSPLGMDDTDFEIAGDKVSRFAACYERNMKKQLVLQDDPLDSAFANRTFYSGGGGLVSIISDYYQFCSMLLNGGELNGTRILGPRTIEYMTKNHLPGNVDLAEFATGQFSETSYEGIGFGLGFATKINAVKNSSLGSEGEYYWGGAASTIFWIDPKEELIVIFLTQLMPSATYDFRGQIQSIVCSSIEK
ncbi:MAG: beta-lactamase family protein [Pseudomonadales bacterium]|nr:beta-lactamase family protein [Pseudomonadales bacterium]